MRRISLLLWVFSMASTAWACPMCKEALSSDPAAAGRVAAGYAVSIAALLGVPAALIAGAGLAIAHSSRRAKRSSKGSLRRTA